MNVIRVDFMQSISVPGKGMITSAGHGKDGITLAYSDATGLVTVTSRGESVLVPLTNVKSLHLEKKPEVPPSKK